MPDTHRIPPGQSALLVDMSTRGRDFHDSRKEAEREFESLREELMELQNRLYAEGQRSLLIVLQAMDAGGKDSTIRRVFRGVNPQGVHVASFKVPSESELQHDFLWRIHREVPRKGMIGIFNRSHYEDVLVARVEHLVPKGEWERRYDHINQFEKLLADSGTTILKFLLHISKDEQHERFEERLSHPEKHWKFSPQDIEKRQHWDGYMEAYDDVLSRCNTEWGPWHVIPADQKWYRNLAISRTIVHTLREMDPQYPQPVEGIEEYRID
ncbi:MAG: polyphosphate kinase 2 family protein [Planctomycetes bacterium]|nr:polyphosphate kinase 2 family protein [Planctomycetota bacterium]